MSVDFPTFTELRGAVKDVLEQALGEGWTVYDYSTGLASLTSDGVVIVARQRVTPFASQQRLSTFDLIVIEPDLSDDGSSEDSLDERLDAVLDALEQSGLSAAFRSAERGTYPVGGSAADCYVITLELVSGK